MAVFGKNILENLTTGMYSDRRVMYREYVQNSCDAIDSAIKAGILDPDQARVDISIDIVDKNITITDNGSGVPQSDFERVLTDIANSDKIRGEDKGFRGIGRLCGLAYCTQLIFATSAIGENVTSIMTWDAKKMRAMLNDSKKRSADEVLNEIVSITTETAEPDRHFFSVKLLGISKESNDLLDIDDIINYLSFEAPVPYDSAFMFYGKIYEHAKRLGVKIDEYPIFVNSEQILKKYRSKIYAFTKVIYDIKDIEFKEFYDENDNLLAWMWFGLSTLDGQIKSENIQRGLRLRRGNIQIGSATALRDQKLYKDGRANEYFIGEVHAIHPDLIPNARRDYFNENTTRSIFEGKLKEFFIILWNLCNIASDDRSAYKSIQTYHDAVKTYNEKEKQGFAGNFEKEAMEEELEKKKEQAEKAKQKLQKVTKQEKSDDPHIQTIIKKVKSIVASVEKKETHETPLPSMPTGETDDAERPKKPVYITNELSAYTRETRKVVSRIYDLINQNAPEFAEDLISKIQTALKSKKD